MDLSIIIVSYNSKKHLQNLLPSLFSQTGVNFETILVDNASTDKTLSWLNKNYPQIKIIKSSKNMGFGAANNLGVKKASAKLVLLLNPDTILKPGCLKNIVDWFRAYSQEQVIGCQLLNPDGSIQPSGGSLPNLLNLFLWALGLNSLPGAYHQNKTSVYKKPNQFDWLSGAALVFKKDFFQKIGGFDKQIFMYGEEVELAYRIKKAGRPIYLNPASQVVHEAYLDKAEKSAKARLAEFKSLIYFFNQHKPGWQQQILKLILKLAACWRIFVFATLNKNDKLKETYEKALKIS